MLEPVESALELLHRGERAYQHRDVAEFAILFLAQLTNARRDQRGFDVLRIFAQARQPLDRRARTTFRDQPPRLDSRLLVEHPRNRRQYFRNAAMTFASIRRCARPEFTSPARYS